MYGCPTRFALDLLLVGLHFYFYFVGLLVVFLLYSLPPKSNYVRRCVRNMDAISLFLQQCLIFVDVTCLSYFDFVHYKSMFVLFLISTLSLERIDLIFLINTLVLELTRF